MQSFWKHRDAFLNPKYKNFGMVAMPYILIFQMLLPFLAPLADIILVLSLIAAGLGVIPASLKAIILFYFVFTLVDITVAKASSKPTGKIFFANECESKA